MRFRGAEGTSVDKVRATVVDVRLAVVGERADGEDSDAGGNDRDGLHGCKTEVFVFVIEDFSIHLLLSHTYIAVPLHLYMLGIHRS